MMGRMRPVTEEQIRSSFINASAEELEQMHMPGLHEMVWEEREFLGWRDLRAPRRGYISHWRGDELVSFIVHASSATMRRGIVAMCSLCHSSQPSTTVRMFSARFAGERGRRGSSMGTYLCESLSCPYVIRRGPAYFTTPEELERRGAAMLQRLERIIDHVADEARR